MKRITVTISDEDYQHVQELMKGLELTESQAVEYFIEKDRVKYFTTEDIKLMEQLKLKKNGSNR